ncbi:pyridoxamine 5'-phosphate oxidase family protein [Paracoccus limosus]|jgi:predicted pyridoxine 5'-phosphate oxidase superfamily flavin-nucleotide-binding protein|uniref:Pyridoxamine 5'-phosphate oxidase family protein n=1 Tax=Paracoccus limosus TaxID=913252 RepID=A0A844GYA1_9RHOB|nr:pyridoxamine 5'-phosphate oxidase family protein [Paracoccus limosus]MTH33646.1 pyridoxamine 5'-phosphate oxidase family protein [Paracoccus limosus]
MTSRLNGKEQAVLCWLATVDPHNRPNVSPKEIYAEASANRLVIADIASGRSVRNILVNPAVCVSLIDIFLQRGRKLEGMAEIIAPDHPSFAPLVAPLLEKTGGAFPIRHMISVNVERSSPILAPSYLLFPDRSEAELRTNAYRSYGVRPIR